MRIDKTFFQRDALTVAEELLGHYLIRNVNGTKIVTKIVETEAYCGAKDKGCHAFGNKRTGRTEAMFSAGGYAYIYLIYGMYHCLNVVAEKEGNPHAVLIRAVEPVEGLSFIKENRPGILKDKDLTNGPGKLTKALSIDMKLNRYDIVTGNELYIGFNSSPQKFTVVSAKRVNIDYAAEYKDKLWRKYIKDNKFVSVK